jgi:hypothetical protein
LEGQNQRIPQPWNEREQHWWKKWKQLIIKLTRNFDEKDQSTQHFQ